MQDYEGGKEGSNMHRSLTAKVMKYLTSLTVADYPEVVRSTTVSSDREFDFVLKLFNDDDD